MACGNMVKFSIGIVDQKFSVCLSRNMLRSQFCGFQSFSAFCGGTTPSNDCSWSAQEPTYPNLAKELVLLFPDIK